MATRSIPAIIAATGDNSPIMAKRPQGFRQSAAGSPARQRSGQYSQNAIRPPTRTRYPIRSESPPVKRPAVRQIRRPTASGQRRPFQTASDPDGDRRDNARQDHRQDRRPDGQRPDRQIRKPEQRPRPIQTRPARDFLSGNFQFYIREFRFFIREFRYSSWRDFLKQPRNGKNFISGNYPGILNETG